MEMEGKDSDELHFGGRDHRSRGSSRFFKTSSVVFPCLGIFETDIAEIRVSLALKGNLKSEGGRHWEEQSSWLVR